MIRDGDWKHLENQEVDEHRMTQKFLARRKQIGENHAADNSIIESVTCVNFMCHNRLHIELGPLINFIVGHNGSGKSAVLTGITLCLGGKAASTNRGSSLKNFIKTGKEQAVLIVKLKNQGNDAYQPDIYGESIIVERHFSRNNVSGYRLKNAMGKLVSSKKGDFDDLIEYYQLQVDNPMNVLTQDAAKTFIQSSTPKQKYKFFKEGVQLEALDNDYKLLSDICDQIEAQLKNTSGDLEVLQKKADDTRAKAKALREQQGMKDKFRNLQRQSAWAQVAEVENLLAEREAAVAAAQEKIAEQERIVEEKDQAFQQTDTLLEKAKEAEANIQDELVPLKGEEEKAKDAHDNARKALEGIRIQREEIKTNLRTGQNKVKGIEAEIKAEMKRMEDANGGAQAQKLAEINEAQQVVSEAKASVTRNEEEGPRLIQSRISAEEELGRIDAALGPKRKGVDSARYQLQELSQNQGDIMAGYDPRMAQLIRAIRNEPGFREKPVGPIGLHLKLLKPLWSHTIETTLGSTLNSFVVTSKSDASILQGILSRIKVPFVNVIIGNHQPINTSGHEPDPQYDTILRVLDIDNALVRNTLIINHAIDQTILIRKRSDGHQTMFNGPRPSNVKVCLTLHDTKRDYGHRLAWIGQNHNQEITGVKFNTGRKPRMKTEIQGQINFQKDLVSQLEREKSQLETERSQAQAKVQRFLQAITVHNRDKGKLKIAVQRAEDRVEKLQIELEKDSVQDGRLDGLNTELAEAKQELAMDQDAYGGMQLEIQRLNEISLEKKRELDAVKERVTDHENKVRKAQLKIRNTAQARKITLEEKNVAITLIADFQEAKAAAERKRENATTKLATYVEQASKVSVRIPIDEGETVESIDAKLQSLNRRLQELRRKQGGTDQEINDAATEANEVYQQSKATRQESEGLLALLKETFRKRVEMYRTFQRFISCRSRINFNYLLSERAFRGKLTIDHKNQKLDVHVEPDETNKSGKGRQTKTLSGGEKSFSSICLLLALWEAMGAPLRCLDEFDVFMDQVNRDVSTNMIVSMGVLYVDGRY